MADISDIENVLVALIEQVIYPSGTGAPSIVTTPCKVFRGWPIPANLDQDLAAGIVNVSVFPTDVETMATRYSKEWHELPFNAATVTLTTTATTITVGGTVASPLNAAALVNGISYIYPVQPNDTATTIATALAILISADTPATNIGPVITIPAAKQLTATVGTLGNIIRETKRQKRGIQITFWCPTPSIRDAIAPSCDRALADLTFISLPDGSAGRILYQRSPVTDNVQRAGLYRRDLIYTVEYGTTDNQTTQQIVSQLFNITGGLDPANPLVKTFSI